MRPISFSYAYAGVRQNRTPTPASNATTSQKATTLKTSNNRLKRLRGDAAHDRTPAPGT